MNSSQLFGNLVQQEQRRILKFSFSIPEPPKCSKQYIQPANILVETMEQSTENEITNDQSRLVSFEEAQTLPKAVDQNQLKSNNKINWLKDEEFDPIIVEFQHDIDETCSNGELRMSVNQSGDTDLL